MKYKVSGNRGNPGSKDITAFYGMNRTGKINDFQLSDMTNMDCEMFPHVGTRRGRGKVTDSIPQMGVICSDSDLNYENYAVSGITDDGYFVYRGEKSDKQLTGGVPSVLGDLELMGSGNDAIYVTQFGGGYFVFPNMDLFTFKEDGVVAKKNYMDLGKVFATDMEDKGRENYENAFFVSCDEDGLGVITVNKGDRGWSKKQGYAGDIVDMLQDGTIACGKSMKLRISYYKDDGGLVNIPNNVVETITGIEIIGVYGDKIYAAGISYDSDIAYEFTHASQLGGLFDLTNVPFWVYIHFEARDYNGNSVDISAYFGDNERAKHFQGSDGFRITSDVYGSETGGPVYSNLAISFVENVMRMGESYGGRLFLLDNLGMTVYYSSANGLVDFSTSTFSGGSGFLSCADPGKWTAMCVYNDDLYVFKRDGMYRIYSGDGLTFYMDRIADVGAIECRGVCIVDDVMYFLSSGGIYRYTGSYPQLLPDSLNVRTFTGGCLGGNRGKVFASVEHDGKNELIVWHTDKQIYSRHDASNIVQFLTAYGEVYALDSDGYVYQMEGERESCDFSIVTKKYFFGFAKKAPNAVRIYFDFEKKSDDDSFQVFVSYDGGAFEACGAKITDGRLRYVPVKFKKCDELALKIAGKGIFTLKGLSFSLYQGGDIKQNHMMKW